MGPRPEEQVSRKTTSEDASRCAGHGVSRTDVRKIKGALLRFEYQATLSLGSDSVPTERTGIHQRIDARNLWPIEETVHE